MKNLIKAIACTTCFMLSTFSYANDFYAQQKEANHKADYVYVQVDESPVYLDGLEGLEKLMKENLKYPKNALENNIVGLIHLDFIVEKDGSLSDISITRNVKGSGLGEEAKRLLSLAKKWKSGVKNGEKVRVNRRLNITFSLENNNPDLKIKLFSPPLPENLDVVYKLNHNQAEPAKGFKEFEGFLNNNLQYPTGALNKDLEKVVLVSFVVDKEGSLTDIKVLRPGGFGFDEEITRLLALSRKWVSGSINEIPVRSSKTMAFKFTSFKTVEISEPLKK
ncbi:TonB family protein [Pedobacter glucosidilyticus]|uniref:TonB family protein n=1 Tax=Pedobacter glucosidilyticus TaxID=1122941 RepID=UPI00040C0FB4|nr:TonB family protein [Pedobacter glucosidilyticus]